MSNTTDLQVRRFLLNHWAKELTCFGWRSAYWLVESRFDPHWWELSQEDRAQWVHHLSLNDQVKLLNEFAWACKGLGFHNPVEVLSSRRAYFSDRLDVVIELFRLAFGEDLQALRDKLSDVRGDAPEPPESALLVYQTVRNVGPLLKQEAERLGRQQQSTSPVTPQPCPVLNEAEKTIVEALKQAGGGPLRGEPLASKAGYSYDYMRKCLSVLCNRQVILKTVDGYKLP
jgi:hypothetical protein